MTELTLYTTEDGRRQINRRAEQQTVWLTRRVIDEPGTWPAVKDSLTTQFAVTGSTVAASRMVDAYGGDWS
ncbi:MAG: hypothetical protein JNL84_05745 [Candidatus Accumulibacter sp.]|nr:hypothetical protein [Accumulibacter sp.]